MRPTARPSGTSAGADPYLPGHGDRGYAVRRYLLDLDYRVATNRLTGRARVRGQARAPLTRLALDLVGLRVTGVSLDGDRRVRWTHRGRRLVVQPGRSLPAGAAFELDVRYAGNPRPSRGPWGEVGWEELTDGVIVAGQPDGAPTWFPCNDRPDDKATYRTAVTVESPYTVVAVGSLVERRVQSSRTTWVFDQPAPTPTYLATVQVGRYGSSELATRPVRQHLVAPVRLRAAALHDFGRQPQMMTAFEDWFGPYPFDAYTVVVTDDDLEIPLEAQGLSAFGANHVDGARGSERLVAHELAHQWFGNSVTLGRWRDIWLHEGFACYAEWLWSQEAGGPSTGDLAAREWRRQLALPQDLLLGDPGPAMMFDDRVYKRGALALHALRLLLGDEAFFGLLGRWTAAHRHGTATTDDFVRLAGGAAPAAPVAALMDVWLTDTRLPAPPG